MKVKREELLKSLSAVDAGLSTKDVIEQSSCYVFRGGRVWTFNDDIACSSELPKPLNGLEFAIPAIELRSLLSKLDEDVVAIEVKGKDSEKQEFVVKTAKRRAGIRVQAEIVLPVSEVEIPDDWKELPKGFAEAVDIVQGCAGQDENMFVLTCIHITPSGMEAMDNYQAIRCQLKTGTEGSILVKREELKKAVGLGMEEWAIVESWVHFRNSTGIVVSCRRWNEKYPELGSLFKVDGQKTPLPKSLVGAVEKAETFMEKASSLFGMNVDLQPGKLVLRAEGTVGWYEERQKIEYDGKPLQFRIAPRLLREICSRSDQCIVGEDKLKVKGGNFIYISCLVEDDDAD